MHARTDAAHERHEPANSTVRFEVGNRQFDSLRVFDGEHDEHDVERLQVEITLEMLKSVDGRVIDTGMSRDGSADDVIEMVFHILPFLQVIHTRSNSLRQGPGRLASAFRRAAISISCEAILDTAEARGRARFIRVAPQHGW